ncbi:hypothetical protein EVJ58_g6878 [Rhodofomes roseus]|uniref:Uncharacterized protein n=1 Tax=Rhodofomes roseus TaxID=34475 RepID=A0A4Y9Y8D0_9APHY|nr:hypothetical protein EVJ58_g6878 [Rhodofomes roseus]
MTQCPKADTINHQYLALGPSQTDVWLHCKMVASSLKVTISNPQQPKYPGPSVVGSWQPRTSGAIKLAAQPSNADATNKHALIRAPWGKPPGRHVQGSHIPITTSHTASMVKELEEDPNCKLKLVVHGEGKGLQIRATETCV